jgi:hypothetical protein
MTTWAQLNNPKTAATKSESILRLDLRTTSTPFIRYLNNAKDSDVRIVVGSDSASKTFHAHSLILKSHSKYYETHLSEVWSGKSKNAASTIIEIKHPELDVKPFEAILRFMYTSELGFPESLLLKVASTAHYLLLGNAVLNKLLDLQNQEPLLRKRLFNIQIRATTSHNHNHDIR